MNDTRLKNAGKERPQVQFTSVEVMIKYGSPPQLNATQV